MIRDRSLFCQSSHESPSADRPSRNGYEAPHAHHALGEATACRANQESCQTRLPLLDCDRLGQVAREIDVETLQDGQPVGNELERDNVQETLEAVDRLRNLDRLGLRSLEFLVTGVADDNGPAATSNDYRRC